MKSIKKLINILVNFKGKFSKCKYSKWKILETLIYFGFYALYGLRDIEKIKKEVKISFSQLNQRIDSIEREEIRNFLFEVFKI